LFYLTLGPWQAKVKRIHPMSDKTLITARQCRAARAFLDLSREDLSRLAEVSVSTIADFELGRREPYERTLRDVQQALETAGVIFIPSDNTAGPGVRLREATYPA
jgi:transcriptional regulator with XRE-family HTH domain